MFKTMLDKHVYFALKVPLVQPLASYRDLKADDLLTMMVPHQPLYPLSKIHVPVFLQPQPGQNIAVFIVRLVYYIFSLTKIYK